LPKFLGDQAQEIDIIPLVYHHIHTPLQSHDEQAFGWLDRTGVLEVKSSSHQVAEEDEVYLAAYKVK
jgi:hypothetical protein